jgi:hypothetical protein
MPTYNTAWTASTLAFSFMIATSNLLARQRYHAPGGAIEASSSGILAGFKD